MRGNVTLHIATGPFVKMTFESRPSLGRIEPFVGLYYEIGPLVEIVVCKNLARCVRRVCMKFHLIFVHIIFSLF